jgi:DNA-binding Lrp family transcriptional regulator
MTVGFVLISAAPAHEPEVYTKLSKTSEVVEVHPLFGEFDLIAKIEVEDFEKLGELVIKKIRSIKGVTDTKTLTGAQSLK